MQQTIQSTQAIPLESGKPTIVIVFEGEGRQRFTTRFYANPQEGQFILAGQELLTIGRILTEARLMDQLKIKRSDGAAPQMTPPNTGN